MKPPFELELAAGNDAAAMIDIVLAGNDHTIEFDAETLKPSVEMVELFALAANTQCFGTCGVGRCTVSLDRKEMHSDSKTWRLRFRAQGLAAQSIAVLVALLAQTAYAGDPLAHVSIQSTPAILGRNAQWLSGIAAQVPAAPPSLSFPVERGVPGRKQRRVTITFVTALSERHRAAFEAAINVWDHLVVFGGFILDFSPQPGFDPAFGSIDHRADHIIEHTLFVDGAETAFNALLNLCDAVHHAGLAIAAVRIE